MRWPSNKTLTLVVSALVALSAAAYLTVTLVGNAQQRARDARQPPPLTAHAAGTQRLLVQRWFRADHPPNVATRADGTDIGLSAVEPSRKTAPGTLGLYLFQSGTPSPTVYKNVRTGDTFTALGIRVTVLKVWRMPNPAHDALDVRIGPA